MPSALSSRSFGQVIGSVLSDVAKVSVGAGVALYVLGGSLNVQRNVNFTPNGTTTGANLQVNGVTVLQRFPVTCTATGGFTKYPTCIAASPYTSTGVLVGFDMNCGGTGVGPLTVSGGFVKTRSAVSATTVFPNWTRKAIGSGALASMSGSALNWNPADFLRINTITSVPTTTNFNCSLLVTTYDKPGS